MTRHRTTTAGCNPTTGKPSSGKPGTGKLSAGKPSAGKPSAGKPSASESWQHEFEELWKAQSRYLFRCCLLWNSGRHEHAEEAFSRAALRAFEKYPKYRGKLDNPRYWLRRLTFNTCMDLHRDESRRRSHLENATDVETLASPHSRSPAGDYLMAERWVHLRAALAELPNRLRTPMELHFLQDMSYSEVATALAISQVNLRKRIQQARALLRENLELYEAGNVVIRELKSNSPVTIPATPKTRVLPTAATVCPAIVRSFKGERRPGELLLDEPLTPRYRRKVEILENYIRRHPSGWKKRFELGKLLRANGHFDDAQRHFQVVASRQRQHLPASVYLAEIFALLDRGHEATLLYQRLAESTQTPATQLHLRAQAQACAGHFSSAAQTFKSAIDLESHNATHWIHLGRLRRDQGRLESSLKAFDQALALDPLNVATLILSHQPLVSIGQGAEARRRAEKALALEPTNILAKQACNRG